MTESYKQAAEWAQHEADVTGEPFVVVRMPNTTAYGCERISDYAMKIRGRVAATIYLETIVPQEWRKARNGEN